MTSKLWPSEGTVLARKPRHCRWGVLTVIGAVATPPAAPTQPADNLLRIPIFLGGLALKSSELPPARRVIPAATLKTERERAQPELGKLLGDVTRWRYGQKAHLESSLEALKLWDEDNPPQLEEIEELTSADGYGLRLRFQLNAVPLERWQEKRERLGRFFAKGLRAELNALDGDRFDLMLLPDA